MFHISWLSLVLSLNLFTLSVHSEIEISPLIFNPYTLKIYDPETNPNLKADDSYVFACPAASEKEHDFVKHVSFRRKSLFVQKFSKLSEEQITCEEGFELSAVYNYEGKFIEFGYEVYFERSQYPQDFVQSDIRNFGWVTEAKKMLHRLDRWMINNPLDPWDIRQIRLKKWGFVWISKVAVQYDTSSWILKTVNYSIHPIKVNQLEIKCSDDNLGSELYDPDRPLDTFYARKNGGAEKYNLLMPYFFKASFLKPVSCSNLTTIPFYFVTAPQKILHHLEIFLIVIAQTTGNSLMISTGVRNTLTRKPSQNVKNKSKLEKIYLYPEKKKIPVPKIIYKIVRYESSEKCNENKEVCWFDVVIVIHNQLKTTIKNDKLCTEDKCSILGWDSIQYLSQFDKEQNKPKLDYVYCCSLDERLANLLNFKWNKKIRSRDLDLRNFPKYNEETRLHEISDKHVQFEQNMYKLLEE